MSTAATIQLALAALLGADGALRSPVPVVARREKEFAAEIEAAAARGAGLCALVMPVLPTSAVADSPRVFFDRAEARVRLVEEPARNTTGCSAWRLADDVAAALQWQPRAAGTPLAGLLAHPLHLASAAVETVSDARLRLVDVIFTATYALPARTVPTAAFTPEFQSAADDLQAACVAQLTAGLSLRAPVLAQRDHDLASDIASAGHPLRVQVLPPRPAGALQGVPFVFFDRYEVRVRITEQPALNTGPDAYDLAEDVAGALHWQPFAGFLAHPLQLAPRCMQLTDSLTTREIDVIFHAALGFEP